MAPPSARPGDAVAPTPTSPAACSAAAPTAEQQLGSPSLVGGESTSKAEPSDGSEDGGAAPEKDEVAPAQRRCSACGKVGGAAKGCDGCKCVWYCGKKCQHKHWKEHKKECRLIKKALDQRGGKLDVGTELDVGPPGKLPPQEECPICMRVLPLHAMLQTQSYCCGKTVCASCDFQHQRKSRELAVPITCEFCRTALPDSDEERLARLRKRVEGEDPRALFIMANRVWLWGAWTSSGSGQVH